MSGDRTHGYDLVLELNDQVLNDNLPAELFAPVRGGREFDLAGFHFSIDFEIFFPRSPTADPVQFDRSIPDGVALTTGFSLNITDLDIDPGPRDLTTAVNGSIRVHHPLSAFDDGADRCVGFDFATLPADRVSVDITDLGGLPVPRATAEQLVARVVHWHLQTNVRQIAAFRLRLAADSDPLTPAALDVRVITDDCAALLLSTTSASAGNRDAFVTDDIPAGANTAILISSRTLLMDLLCPYLLRELGLTGDVESYFTYADGAATLSDPTDISDLIDHALVDHITLTRMRIATGDDWLEASATLGVRGFGYRATIGLSGRVDVSVDEDGNIDLAYSAEVAEVDMFVEPWVWILVALGAGIVPVVGAVVAVVLPILPWILNPVLDAIASSLHVDGETEYAFPPFPIRIDSIILDELLCTGRAVAPPRESTPRADAWIDGELVVSDSEVGNLTERRIIGPVTETVITLNVAHEGRFTGRTERMMFPVTYAWRLDGQDLAGTGSGEIGGVTVTHAVDGASCTLSFDEGDSFSGTLEMTARSADGVTLSASKLLEVEGSKSIRSVHNAEIIEGPPAELQEMLYARDRAPIDWPAPPFAAGRSYAVSAGRNPAAELRRALKAGTGFDFEMERPR